MGGGNMYTIKLHNGLYFKNYLEDTEELIFTDSKVHALKFKELTSLEHFVDKYNIENYSIGLNLI